VSCGTTATDAGFDCAALLPGLTVGSHTIELAAFVDDGGVLESARSSPLRVALQGLTLSGGAQIDPRVVTVDQLQLELGLVTEGLALPTDLAFAPDGSILVAERGGTVRVIRHGALLPRAALDMSADVSLPEGGLLALALDPAFAESRLVYTLAATRSRSRDLAFTLSRYRDVADTFGERAVLLDRVPVSPDGASGALRVGPDGKLYVALSDAASGRAAANMGSFNGKVLRLNADGTTPDDQAGATPIYALDHPLPHGLDWQPASGEMWVADAVEPTSGRLTAVGAENVKQRRGVARVQYALPPGTGVASVAFYKGRLVSAFRDNLFVAAETARNLIRLRFDPQSPERIVSAERLLQDQIGAVRVVSVGPDEALYVGNETALFRIAP
jgi:glucose/arabinose dehydrogenase